MRGIFGNSRVIESVPKGFEPGAVKEDPPPGAPPEIKFLMVSPKAGGGEPMSVIVLQLKGRFYVGFGVKKKTEVKPRP